MKRTITEIKCDICGKDAVYEEMPLIAHRTYDSTDGQGRYKSPLICTEKADLCEECAIKATNVHSIGVQCMKLEIKAPPC